MEIRNLTTFIHVAELNSFTRAAETLGYSQSTVSFQIRQLEEELGCRLFDRINHSISLTDRGYELLEYAQRICRLTDEFNQNLNSEKPLSACLHILAPNSVCEEMMRTNYLDFYSKHPGISLRFTSADTDDMLQMLERNEGDVMLALDTHTYRHDCIIAKEEPVGMHFVTGAGSEFAQKRTLTLKEIAKYPFILTEKNAGYRRPLDRLFAKYSLEISPILEMERTDIIASVLEGGIGVSYLPDFVTRNAVEDGRLCYLDVPDAKIDIWKQLIYHKNKWISRALSALIDYIKEKEFSADC